jgi:hypothetical protein
MQDSVEFVVLERVPAGGVARTFQTLRKAGILQPRLSLDPDLWKRKSGLTRFGLIGRTPLTANHAKGS